MVIGLKFAFKLSGNSDLPLYVGFIVIKTPLFPTRSIDSVNIVTFFLSPN